MSREVAVKEVTIAASAAVTANIGCGGMDAVAIIMPAAWTAAALTFQAGDGASMENVFDDSGTEVSVSAAADRYIPLPTTLKALHTLLIRSGTSGVPVNQAAERTLKVVFASR